jgi:hypothetical protein
MALICPVKTSAKLTWAYLPIKYLYCWTHVSQHNFFTQSNRHYPLGRRSVKTLKEWTPVILWPLSHSTYPQRNTLQKCWLVITNTLAIHLWDAKCDTLHTPHCPFAQPLPPISWLPAQSFPHQQAYLQPSEHPRTCFCFPISNQSPAPAEFVLNHHCYIGSL